jgi:ketosteroid isomerase-like protein
MKYLTLIIMSLALLGVMPCQSESSDHEGESTIEDMNKQIVGTVYGAFGSGDMEALMNALSDEVKYIINGPADILPYCGVYDGKEGVSEFLSILGSSHEVLAYDVKKVISEGNLAVSFVYEKMKVISTGKIFEVHPIHVFTIENNQVVQFEAIYDTYPVVQAYIKD